VADQPEMQVEVTEDGPYIVRSTPLVRTGVVESEYGESIAWEPDDPMDAGRSYSLCRCGGSSTKPFCDDTHRTNGFDGTEVADHGPRADRARILEGDGVEVTDDPSLCTHVGFCTTRRTHIWEMVAETSDPEVRERLISMISKCPSGRLAHRPSAAEPEVEPPYPASVAVVRDGPLWVRGGVQVIGADGVPYERRNRITLCRCGHSQNKPFCDGTHYEIGFSDADIHEAELNDRDINGAIVARAEASATERPSHATAAATPPPGGTRRPPR
jgi:CDGSH-type Zn-finger protein